MRRTRADPTEGEPSPRRSFGWFKDIQEQQRASGCIVSNSAVAPQEKEATKNVAVLKGLVAPVFVPFVQGRVNIGVIGARYAPELVTDGVGSVVVGFGNEWKSLSLSERKDVISAWSQSPMKVCVDVSCFSSSDQMDLIRFAESCSVSALCVGFEATIPRDDVIDRLSILSKSTTLPLLFHHTAESYLGSDVIQTLMQRGSSIRGIVVDGSASDVSSLTSLIGPTFTDVVSVEGTLVGSILGCTSHIAAALNFAAPLFARLTTAATKGDIVTSRKLSSCLSSTLQVNVGEVRKIRFLTGLRLQIDLGVCSVSDCRVSAGEAASLQKSLSSFVAAYTSLVGADVKKAVIDVKSLPGYNGLLNNKFRSRIAFLEKEVGRQFSHMFPHLYPNGVNPSGTSNEADMSWRKPIDESKINPARFIDHTVLKADATEKDVLKLCQEAKEHNFFAVCVNGSRALQCLEELKGSDVKVAAVIGFPLGAGTINAKAHEAAEIVSQGATEIDMVINVGALKDGNYGYVYDDIAAVCKAVVNGGRGNKLKVIFETCLLSDEQVIDVAILSVAAGAHFIKTSTGFSTGGALPKDIDVMLAISGNQAEVKASGGVRDRESALAYVSAGVMRIGTSSGVTIVKGSKSTGGY